MNILDIIAKKRDSKELTKQEIEYFVKEYTVGNITDYQAAALIMAIYIKGMNDEERPKIVLLVPMETARSPSLQRRSPIKEQGLSPDPHTTTH